MPWLHPARTTLGQPPQEGSSGLAACRLGWLPRSSGLFCCRLLVLFGRVGEMLWEQSRRAVPVASALPRAASAPLQPLAPASHSHTTRTLPGRRFPPTPVGRFPISFQPVPNFSPAVSPFFSPFFFFSSLPFSFFRPSLSRYITFQASFQSPTSIQNLPS